jgi:hypothetical protein
VHHMLKRRKSKCSENLPRVSYRGTQMKLCAEQAYKNIKNNLIMIVLLKKQLIVKFLSK